MSYDIELRYEDGVASVARHEEGGTYAIGGTLRAELNVTYNYSNSFLKANFSIRDLNGRPAKETISVLQKVVEVLGIEWQGGYWDATDGNAGYAANILLGWARQHPSAVWEVT